MSEDWREREGPLQRWPLLSCPGITAVFAA